MVIIQTYIALAAGLAVTMALTLGMTLLFRYFAPDWAAATGTLEASFAIVSLGVSFLSAAAGGLVTSSITAANPIVLMLVLAIVVLALAALSALQSKGKLPIWFLLAQVAAAPLGVLAGGLLGLQLAGIQ